MGNYKIEKELKVKYDIYPTFKYRARGVAHDLCYSIEIDRKRGKNQYRSCDRTQKKPI
jgi:hypothetical protein